MNDQELDAFLTNALDVAPIPEREFTSALVERLQRHRRRRQIAVGVALALSTVAAAVALYLSPASLQIAADASPAGVVAGLVLATLCCLVWIGTESRSLGIRT